MNQDPAYLESSQHKHLNVDLNKGTERYQRNQSRQLWLIKVFLYAIGISILVLFILPVFMPFRARGKSDSTEAINNIKQIGLALFEFESDFKTFPSPSRVSVISSKFPYQSHDLSGTSSNAMFRQLFVASSANNERIFYAKIPGSKKPNSLIEPGHLLEKGEVAFSYISGLSSKDNPSTPVVLCPLIPGTTKFDPKPFKGNAVILHVDQSAVFYKIDDDGHVYIDGIDILSPKHPIWKGKPPTIHYPEL